MFCVFAVYLPTTPPELPFSHNTNSSDYFPLWLAHLECSFSPNVFFGFFLKWMCIKREREIAARTQGAFVFVFAPLVWFTSHWAFNIAAHIAHSFGLNRGNRLSSVDTHSHARRHTHTHLSHFWPSADTITGGAMKWFSPWLLFNSH